MKRTIEKAARVLAVTAALTAGMGEIAVADAGTYTPTKKERAFHLASKYSKELYKSKQAYSRSVAVPGILNGTVEVDINSVSGVHEGGYRNPILLVEAHPTAKHDTRGRWLDGSWIATVGGDAQGHAVLTPVQIELGKDSADDETVSLHLNNPHEPILTDASIYASKSNDPSIADSVFAYDRTGNGNFPSIQVESFGMK
jgi:hypothetical protein